MWGTGPLARKMKGSPGPWLRTRKRYSQRIKFETRKLGKMKTLHQRQWVVSNPLSVSYTYSPPPDTLCPPLLSSIFSRGSSLLQTRPIILPAGQPPADSWVLLTIIPPSMESKLDAQSLNPPKTFPVLVPIPNFQSFSMVLISDLCELSNASTAGPTKLD